MARKSHLWYSITVRILTGIAAILAIAVMAASAYALTGYVTDQNKIKEFIRNTTTIDFPTTDDSTTNHNYKTLMIVCFSVAIFAGLLQLVASLNALCSCSKNVSGRVKTWLVMHVITILLLILCFLLPFTYDKDRNTAVGLDKFGSNIKNFIQEILQHENWLKNLYYITIIINDVVIFIFMIFLGCCLQCGDYAYESVY